MKKHFLWISLLLAGLLLIGGCSSGGGDNQGEGNSSDEKAGKGTITLGYNQWPARIATANMWKQILEEQGYTVELKPGSKGPLYAGLSKGDVDILSQVWLPHADKEYVEEYKDGIVKHKKWYSGATLGLTVPQYVDVDDISQLNQYKDEFEGRIVGIEPGASIMQLTDEVIQAYGLDYQLIESSDSAMMSELKKAYENQEPILVTLWEPHWAFAEYDLKFLEDPNKIYGEPDDIYWFSRTGFEEEFPEVATYFNQWEMTDEQLASLINATLKAETEEKGVQEWLSQHQDLVEQWTSSD